MANELIEYLKGRKPKGFRSCPFYSREGDFLTFYFKGGDHYAKRLDENLTVYRAMTEDECVGFKLKGVRHLLEALGDLHLQVFDAEGNLRLSMLLIAGAMKTKDPSALPAYQKFARKTGGAKIKKRELQPA